MFTCVTQSDTTESRAHNQIKENLIHQISFHAAAAAVMVGVCCVKQILSCYCYEFMCYAYR